MAITRNPHKPGVGKSTLGSRWQPLKAFAEKVCEAVRDRIPEFIADQVMRVDFFQHPRTGKYYVNEIESKLLKLRHCIFISKLIYSCVLRLSCAKTLVGVNAQVLGLNTDDGNSKIHALLNEYYFNTICACVDLHLQRNT